MNLTDGQLHRKTRRITALAELWLEARLSQEEERELMDFVRGVNIDTDGYAEHFSSETLVTLRLLKAETLYADRWIDEAASAMPAAVQERMATHIHTLAAAESHQGLSPFAKRLIRYGTAAAAVVLILFAGWHYYSINSVRENGIRKDNIIAQIPAKDISWDSAPRSLDIDGETTSRANLAGETEISDNSSNSNVTAGYTRQKRTKSYQKSLAMSEVSDNQYAEAETDNRDYDLPEDIDKSIQLLEENLNMVMAYNTHINNKVTNDLIIVDDLINRVEDDLEYVISSVGTLKRPQLDVDEHIFISPATAPADPISF